MAQKEKYTDEKLTDAVIRYSEAFPGKIKVSVLARWASTNIPGLEGVKAHNFRSKRKVVNKRTGKVEELSLGAFERIQTINKIRTGDAAVRTNELFKQSDPDVFLGLPRMEQRRQIIETRGQYEKLADENRELRRQNNILKTDNICLRDDIEKLRERLGLIQKRQEQIEKKISLMVNIMDREKQRETLNSMGVMDGGFDLEKYQESLRLDIDEVFSISQSIKSFREKLIADSGSGQVGADTGHRKTIDNILGGLDI